MALPVKLAFYANRKIWFGSVPGGTN